MDSVIPVVIPSFREHLGPGHSQKGDFLEGGGLRVFPRSYDIPAEIFSRSSELSSKRVMIFRFKGKIYGEFLLTKWLKGTGKKI